MGAHTIRGGAGKAAPTREEQNPIDYRLHPSPAMEGLEQRHRERQAGRLLDVLLAHLHSQAFWCRGCCRWTFSNALVICLGGRGLVSPCATCGRWGWR